MDAATAHTSDAATKQLAEDLDRLPLGRTHLLVITICALGLVFDGLEMTISTVFATIFTPKQGVPPGQLAILISGAVAGAAIGGPLFGVLADRLGRRIALAAALASFGLLSIVCGLSPDFNALTVARFFTCFAIGAYHPLTMTYMVDVLPKHLRGRFMLLAAIFIGLGSATPMFLTRWFNELGVFGGEGWRATLFVGGAGGVAVALLAWAMLPESPIWLLSRGRTEEASRAFARFARGRFAGSKPAPAPAAAAIVTSVAPEKPSLFRSPYLAATVLFFAIEFLTPWAISLVTMTGAMFARRGYDQNTSLMFSGVSVLFGPVGYFIASFVVDRFSRWAAVSVSGLLLGVLALTFFFAKDATGAVVVAGMFNMLIGPFMVTLMIWGTELFPTSIRARASTLAFACNRLGSLIVPPIALPLLHKQGELPPMAIIAVVQIAIVLAIITYGRRLKVVAAA